MFDKIHKFIEDEPDVTIGVVSAALLCSGYILGRRRKPRTVTNVYVVPTTPTI